MTGSASWWRRSSRGAGALLGAALWALAAPAGAADELLCSVATTPPPAAAAGEVLTQGAGEPLAAFAQRLLPAGNELAAQPVEVELPPLGRVPVILFQPRDEEHPLPSNYTGWVLVPERGQARTFRRAVLPPLAVVDGLFEIEVKSIFAAAVGTGTGRDLCVLYSYYRTGSGEDPGDATEVYHWTGKEFVKLEDAGRTVVGLNTAGKIRDKLRKWRPRPSK